jgi:hypothetical protein
MYIGARGFEPPASKPQRPSKKAVREAVEKPLAHSLARETQIDPDLARLIDAWPNLSPTVKRMILAALEASGPGA